MGVADIGHPVTHRLVDRILEGRLSGGDADHLGAEEAHSGDIQGLTLHVDRSHVDPAGKSEARGGRGRRHAVLTRPRLGYDPLLAHAACEEDLTEGIVNFMRSGVEEVFPLEVDLRAAEFLSQAFREIERRRPADKLLKQGGEFVPESGILAGGGILPLEVEQGGHQCLRDKAAAVRAEVAVLVGQAGEVGRGGSHGMGQGVWTGIHPAAIVRNAFSIAFL